MNARPERATDAESNGLYVTGEEIEMLDYGTDTEKYELVARRLNPEEHRWDTEYDLVFRDKATGRTYMAHYAPEVNEKYDGTFHDQTCPEVVAKVVTAVVWVKKGKDNVTL